MLIGYLRRSWAGLPAPARDALLPAFLLIAATVPRLGVAGVILGDLPRRPVDAVAVLLAVGQCLPLAVGRRYPGWCLLGTAASFAAYQLAGYPTTITSLGVLVAVFNAGRLLRIGRQWVAAAGLAGYALLTVALQERGSPETGIGFMTFALVPATLWLVGSWVHDRVRREREHRERQAALAIAEERARIARELHDVVTHHVTAMVVQADAAGFQTGDPETVQGRLTSISGTGRRALAELRYLLDVLGGGAGGSARQPVLADAGALVDQVRGAGQPVGFTERGEYANLPDAVQLAAYRVVQEALTNAVKYAPGRATEVELRRDDDGLAVTVRNAGGRVAVAPGGGRGLAGLTERVTVLGGTFDAGPDQEGDFVVQATFPAAGWSR